MKYPRVTAVFAVLALAAACANGADDVEASDEDRGQEAQGEDQEAAGDFPSEPITLIVQFAAGGANDLLMRMLAPKMSEVLGVPVGVENIEGGSGVIGLTEAYNRPADGHTLVTWSPPGEYLSEVQGEFSGFTVDDFVMIGAANVDPGAIAVPIDSPYQTLEALNDAMAQTELSAATSGLTSNNAVGAMSYMAATGLDFTLVPYDSGAELTAALIGGTTDFGMRAGGWYDLHEVELRILALTSAERVSDFPDIPTVAEITGEDVIFSAMRGLAVRSDTPQEHIDILVDAFETAANDPSVRDRLLDEIGFRWEYLGPEEAADVADQMMASVDEFASELGL